MGFSPKSRKRKKTRKKDSKLDDDEVFDFNHDVDSDTDPRVSSKQLDREISKKIDFWLHREKRSEDRSAAGSVLDTQTLTVLDYFLRRGLIDPDIALSTISAGKEAVVFYSMTHQGDEVAIKIYRTVTSDFKKREPYLVGDPRFRTIRKTTQGIVYTWAQKEFKNLQRAFTAGIPVPQPLYVRKNVLIISFIGNDRVPAQLLRNSTLKHPDKTFNRIIELVRILYKDSKLVHADLSDYNILMWNELPIFIDFAQAVLIAHPMSELFLKRDLQNLAKYFSRLGVSTEAAEKLYDELIENS